MNSHEEARDVARGLIDVELGLCYTNEEAEGRFGIGTDDDPLVQRLGRSEFERRRAEAERLFAERYPDDDDQCRGCFSGTKNDQGRR